MGATVVQVLRSTFTEVVLAERKLKTSHADDILTKEDPLQWWLAFGAWTAKYSPGGHTVTLTDALPGAEDITHLF